MSESTLLERVEAAAGPDREIDALIAEQLGDFAMVYRAFDGAGAVVDVMVEQTEDDFDDCPRYTASIDAALALVERALPDADFIDVFRDADLWFARIAFTERGGVTKFDSGGGRDTAALALLAALLKATPEQSDV